MKRLLTAGLGDRLSEFPRSLTLLAMGNCRPGDRSAFWGMLTLFPSLCTWADLISEIFIFKWKNRVKPNGKNAMLLHGALASQMFLTAPLSSFTPWSHCPLVGLRETEVREEVEFQSKGKPSEVKRDWEESFTSFPFPDCLLVGLVSLFGCLWSFFPGTTGCL